MSQSLNLSVSGEYTSMNDMNGLPPGALDLGLNVESRYKNVIGPRRGFEELPDSSLDPVTFKRLGNFLIAGVSRIIALTDAKNLVYYVGGGTPWLPVPGDYASNIIAPNALNAKSRFITAGQNFYVTAQDGVKSLASGSSSQILRAGVPKGLNLEAQTNTDTDGFFNNNVAVATTGTLTSSSAILTDLADTSGIQIDQYVTGTDVSATLVIQDLTYTSELFGVLGNAVTVAYTTGGTAGAEVVTVVGNAISVQIQSGVSTATQVRTALLASAPAMALVSVTVTGTGSTAQTAPVAATNLSGGLDNTIPIGTKVASITPEAPIIIQTANTTAGSASVTNAVSITGVVAGVLVTGVGIPDGAKVVSTSGGGPYTIVLSLAAYQTATGVSLTFSTPLSVTMDQDALSSVSGTPISFYAGSQVAYRMLFGRVESDIDGNTITRVGAPSSQAIANNISPYSTNTTVTGTLPKNAENEITFVQLFRSPQTDSISISPLDQYNLVYERDLTSTDFTNRVITITDSVPDSLKGIPLYAGSDREGILQSNNPPPMCWDMCTFRDFNLYANATQPSTLTFTIVAVGAPNGIQVDDTITISGTFLGNAFTETYTAKTSENQASRQFAVVTSGTPSQNITDTANSLIRVINYDEGLPIHAILLSTSTDLPGQILLESDDPSYDTFSITANLHQDAYDPTLDDVESDVNTLNNGVYVSKADEIEAVPSTNLLRVGDSSSPILRVVPLRDYVIVLKTDGIYKIQGLTPSSVVANPFDLTTRIIGAETAVPLNSGVWFLSNQGVVSVSDGGVDAKSIPIDNQLNRLIGTYLENLTDVSFGVGYESDRKYILSVPNSENDYTETQHVFNYVTNTWTRWDRKLRAAFVHSNEGKLYISTAEPNDNGVSRERKTATYRDYVDEGFDTQIVTVITDTNLQLLSLDNVEVGDILYQDAQTFSPILEIDLATSSVVVESALAWDVGAVRVLTAYTCEITWKQVFGDNPAFVRQFQEGLVLFKNTRFNSALMRFETDFSGNIENVTIFGTGNGLWGLFPWGEIPWGGSNLPVNIRFLVPQNKQLGSFLRPTLRIKQGYSDFILQGLSISYANVSQEVGR